MSGGRSDDPAAVVIDGSPTHGRLTVMQWTEEKARAALAERSGGNCELGCGKPAESFSHRKRRSQAGEWTPVNAVHTCGDGTRGCHGLLGAFPRFARAGGWEVDATADPATVPVYLVTAEGAAWWLLGYDEFGHVRTWVDPEEYGLPERPVMPREFPARARQERESLRAGEEAALVAWQDEQAAAMAGGV